MAVHERIEINPQIMLGKPVIRGARITVELILRKISEERDEAALLQAYPHLTRGDIRAAVRYAADMLAHEEVVMTAAGPIRVRGFLQLLTDESCDASLVVGLRAAGHDVISISESMRGAADAQVVDFANSQRRLLLTEDKDFGKLVFSATKQNSGVVLIHYPACARSDLTNALTKFLTDYGVTLYSCFAVLEPGRARISALVL